MAASKTTKKSPARSTGNNKKLATTNNGQRKKVMILSLLAFAIVGVVVIARSFAATTISSAGIGSGLKIYKPGTSPCKGYTQTSADKNNSKVARLDCLYSGATGIAVTGPVVSLGAGNYQLCAVSASMGTGNNSYKLRVWNAKNVRYNSVETNVARDGLIASASPSAIKNSNGSERWEAKCVNFSLSKAGSVQGEALLVNAGSIGVGSMTISRR